MHTVKAILDTGAGPDIVHQKAILSRWQNCLIRTELPQISDVNQDPIALLAALDLHLHIDDLQVRSRFLVTSNLAAECILGTSFIDKYVKAILPKGKRVLLKEGSPVALRGPPTRAKKEGHYLKRPYRTITRCEVSVNTPDNAR